METVDRTGTFLGSLWESKTNVAVALLEAGLAKFQTSFGTDRIPDAHLLEKAEQSAKRLKLKVRNRTNLIHLLFVAETSYLNFFLLRFGRIMLKERKFPMGLL